MKRFMYLLVLSFIALASCGYKNNDADSKIGDQQEQMLLEANAQVGMPAIKNFQERKLAKMIFELRDQENLICFAYLKSDYTGKLVYIGKCMGFGLPYSVQFTNPQKLATKWISREVNEAGGGHFIDGTISQADPNGLYMPEGLSATWLMMLDKNGKPHPVYIESDVIVSPFELEM